ncbi:MAG: DNA-binding protein [Ilumatobacteraceae bacterium]|nr:DNA-binding protein [Ilumatobacteraceae bacterium]
MPQPDLTAVRDQLDSDRAELTRQLGELVTDGAAGDVDENFADTAQVAAEQVESRTLAATLQDQLADIESALARIDDGTYGTCEVCEKEIGAARLEAMPSARSCIDHA